MSAASRSWPTNDNQPGPTGRPLRGPGAPRGAVPDEPGEESRRVPARVTGERPTDIAAVGDVLARACADSPLRSLLPGDHTVHRRLLGRLFTHVAGWAAVHGAVYLHSDGAGAAIWLPADHHLPPAAVLMDGEGTVADAFDAALIDLDADLDDATYPALYALAELLRPTALAGEPTRAPTFLFAVGVDPEHRCRGVARQLLDAHHEQLASRYATTLAVATDPAGQRLLASTGYAPHHVDHVPVISHAGYGSPVNPAGRAGPTGEAGGGVVLQWMTRRPY